MADTSKENGAAAEVEKAIETAAKEEKPVKKEAKKEGNTEDSTPEKVKQSTFLYRIGLNCGRAARFLKAGPVLLLKGAGGVIISTTKKVGKGVKKNEAKQPD